MTVRLRIVAPADLAPLARLHAQCFPSDSWDVAALAGVLAMPGASGRVAEDAESRLLGFIFDLIVRDEAEILTIGVAAAARRHGLGRMLLDDLFARTRIAGVRKVVLEVAADNDAALALYVSCGFRIVGRRRGYYQRPGGDPIDAWLLSRHIDP